MSGTDLAVARPSLAVAAFKALRIKQWTKNGALLAPLLFAKGVVREGLPLKSVVAVLAFSFLASGVYLVNDWVDKEKDRLHPEKRHRPIAAGLLGPPMIIVGVALCWAVAATLGFWLGPQFLGVCAAYLILQVLYTLALKKAVILDVMVIALGFILRVVAGAVHMVSVEIGVRRGDRRALPKRRRCPGARSVFPFRFGGQAVVAPF